MTPLLSYDVTDIQVIIDYQGYNNVVDTIYFSLIAQDGKTGKRCINNKVCSFVETDYDFTNFISFEELTQEKVMEFIRQCSNRRRDTILDEKGMPVLNEAGDMTFGDWYFYDQLGEWEAEATMLLSELVQPTRIVILPPWKT